MRLARRGDARAGLDLVRESVTLAPRKAELALGLAEIWMNLGDAQSALAEAARAVEAEPRSASARRVLGQMLLDVGELERGTGELEEAVRLDPADADAWYALGSTYHTQQGMAPRAREALEKAVRLAPRFAPARRDLAAVLIRYGALAEAERHLREAVRLDPRDPVSHAELGAALRRGRTDPAGRAEAERELRRAIQLDAQSAGALYELGLLLGELRRWPEAREALEEAARLAPRSQGTWYHLAAAYERLGDSAAAAGARARFRLLAETQPEIAAALAEVDRRPDDVGARLRLARLHLKREEQMEGVEQLRAAHRLAPADPRVRALAEELRRRGIVRPVPRSEP